MTLSELSKTYYFHDSLLEEVEVNSSHNEVTLKIDFCLWMQNWYSEDKHPETKLINFVFKNVQKTTVSEFKSNGDAILDINLLEDKNGNTGINFLMDNYREGFYVLTIFASEVEVN